MGKKCGSIFIAMLFLVVLVFASAVSVLAGDISGEVVIDNIQLKVYRGSNWLDVIDGNTVYNQHLPLKKSELVKLDIFWNIPAINMSNVNENDIFEIALPSTYVNFGSAGDRPLMNQQAPYDELGTWKIAGGKIIVTINAVGASKPHISNGFFEVSGFLLKDGNDVILNVGDKQLPPIDIEPGADSGLPAPEMPNYGKLSKNGSTLINSDKLQWNINVNYENYKKVYEGTAPEQLNDVTLEDDLTGGQTITQADISIRMLIYLPTDDGKMSSSSIYIRNLLDQFTYISQNSGESYDAFYTRVKNTGPAYGIYDSHRVVISFKDLPNNGAGLRGWPSDSLFDTWIQNLANRYSTAQLQVLEAAYSSQNPAKGDVIGISVVFNASPPGSGTYTNKAIIKYSGQELDASSNEVEFQDIKGGASSGSPGDLILYKQNQDEERLMGVTFKLQKQDGLGDYHDYTLTNGDTLLTTDASGTVHFKSLEVGDYRIVEVAGLDGYTNRVTYSPSDTFSITGMETIATTVIATNYQAPASTPGTTPQAETPGTPRTGDEDHIAFHLILLVISGAAIYMALRRRMGWQRSRKL
ncbi:prealbumin-like fold domain-containing protein [Eubacteriales bacterium OttesenSCG-928-M02]|nr:prealbumin-like fold domain-containing protein [Eubacteriales bacterium OttesenSCG-928-M02]